MRWNFLSIFAYLGGIFADLTILGIRFAAIFGSILIFIVSLIPVLNVLSLRNEMRKQVAKKLKDSQSVHTGLFRRSHDLWSLNLIPDKPPILSNMKLLAIDFGHAIIDIFQSWIDRQTSGEETRNSPASQSAKSYDKQAYLPLIMISMILLAMRKAADAGLTSKDTHLTLLVIVLALIISASIYFARGFREALSNLFVYFLAVLIFFIIFLVLWWAGESVLAHISS